MQRTEERWKTKIVRQNDRVKNIVKEEKGEMHARDRCSVCFCARPDGNYTCIFNFTNIESQVGDSYVTEPRRKNNPSER